MVAGEVRGCLHANRLPGRIQEAELVEGVVTDAFPGQLNAVFFHHVSVRGHPGVHPGERRRREFELVQAEEQLAIGQHTIRMLPRVGGDALAEAEPLVEGDRLGDVAGLDADFVEPS